MSGFSRTVCATESARWGSPGSSTRSASSAAGRRWMGGVASTAGNLRARARPRCHPSYTLPAMPDRRDIPDALRDAVERTVQATVGTRERAQGAASELSASVDELVKGAEKGLSRSGRSVRAAVEERLPATQEDVKAIRPELRRIGKR